MNDIMVDLETMDTAPTAAIIAIGAVFFNHISLGREFYMTIDLQSAVDAGGTMSPATILWWMQQSDEARAEFAKKAMNIRSVLLKFSAWVYSNADPDSICVWGNGSDLDNVVLRTAYDRLDLPAPWKYYNNRCFRTFKAENPDVSVGVTSTKHKALDDARWQAQYMIEARKG